MIRGPILEPKPKDGKGAMFPSFAAYCDWLAQPYHDADALSLQAFDALRTCHTGSIVADLSGLNARFPRHKGPIDHKRMLRTIRAEASARPDHPVSRHSYDDLWQLCAQLTYSADYFVAAMRAMALLAPKMSLHDSQALLRSLGDRLHRLVMLPQVKTAEGVMLSYSVSDQTLFVEFEYRMMLLSLKTGGAESNYRFFVDYVIHVEVYNERRAALMMSLHARAGQRSSVRRALVDNDMAEKYLFASILDFVDERKDEE